MATATPCCQWHGRKERTNAFRTRSCAFCKAADTGRRASTRTSSTGRLRASWPAEREELFSGAACGFEARRVRVLDGTPMKIESFEAQRIDQPSRERSTRVIRIPSIGLSVIEA